MIGWPVFKGYFPTQCVNIQQPGMGGGGGWEGGGGARNVSHQSDSTNLTIVK